MKVAYIIGPYRARNVYEMVQNIRRAEKVALKYWKQGFAVICPHKNTALMDGANTDVMFLKGDWELIKKADVIIVMKNWEKSQGSVDEVELAKGLQKAIIYDY